MSRDSVKYILMADSRIDESEAMESKHLKVINFLMGINNDWGLDNMKEYQEPKFGTGLIASFSLYKKMGKGIKGNIMYGYRRLITDHHSCDDRLWIEFIPTQSPFKLLIDSVVRKYIKGFKAYILSIYPESLIYTENNIPQYIRNKLNFRKDLEFFYPFQYMDDILIGNVFGCTSDEFFRKLQAAKILSEKLEGGVYFRAADEIVNLESSLNFNKKVQDALNVTLPIIN